MAVDSPRDEVDWRWSSATRIREKSKGEKPCLKTGVMHLATEEQLGAATLPPQKRGGKHESRFLLAFTLWMIMSWTDRAGWKWTARGHGHQSVREERSILAETCLGWDDTGVVLIRRPAVGGRTQDEGARQDITSRPYFTMKILAQTETRCDLQRR